MAEPKRVKRGALSMMIRPADGVAAETPRRAASRPKPLKSVEANTLAASVGKEIRTLRLGLNMTASDLAASAGVSNGMLSKIERGTTTPSFATLSSLSRALKVPVARFFASHDQRADLSLVRSGRGIAVQRRGSKAGFSYELLGHLLSGEKYVEPYLVTISSEATPSPGFQHTGIEFMHILSGRMAFRYADTVVDIGPGDTLVFDANAVHGHERLIEEPVRFLSVVFNLRA
jgi:transcriptional regulator with XRE-family HTH domain